MSERHRDRERQRQRERERERLRETTYAICEEPILDQRTPKHPIMPSGAKKRKAAKKKKEAHPNTNTNLSISISTNNPRGQGIQYLKFSTFAVFSFELGPIRPIHTCPICHSNHALYFFHQSLFFDVVFGHFGLMGICYAFCLA